MSLDNTGIDDHLEIIIVFSVLPILPISLRELYKTPNISTKCVGRPRAQNMCLAEKKELARLPDIFKGKKRSAFVSTKSLSSFLALENKRKSLLHRSQTDNALLINCRYKGILLKKSWLKRPWLYQFPQMVLIFIVVSVNLLLWLVSLCSLRI